MPDLIVLLKGIDPVLAMFAAEALGQIGPKAKEAVPTLRVTRQEPERRFLERRLRELG